jgi:hypothetical protein
MALEPKSSLREVRQPAPSTYQCPGCGENVDSTRMDQVLAHHQHLIFRPSPPSWSPERSRDGQRAAGGSRGDAAASRPRTEAARQRDEERRALRYGHDRSKAR